MTQSRTRGLPRYKGSGLLHGLLLFLSVIEVAFIIAQAIFLARAITFLFEGTALVGVLPDAGYFLLAFVLRYSVNHLQAFFAERYAKNTARMLRHKLMQAYFGGNLFLIQKKGIGHLVTLTMDGVDQLKAYLEIISIRMFKTVIIPAIIGVYVLTLDLTSAVILVVAVPVIIMFMILLGKAAQAMADKQYATYRRLANHFIDSLKGLETLVFLGKSRDHAKKIDRVSDDYRQATMKTLRVAFLSSFALDFFTSLSIAFVAVGLGLRLIDGQIDLLPALTILILAPEYFSPIKQVGKDYHATLDGQVAMNEINSVLNEAATENNQSNLTLLSDQSTSGINNNNRLKLRLNDVTVNLDNKYLLDSVSLDMPEGWVGIVGPSGSGKSTLINVLAGRLQPTSGSIDLNDITLKGLDDAQWFDKIAYIPQDPYIFPVSLADNIRFYAPYMKDSSVEALVVSIGLGPFVDTLPNGVHEMIGEGGRVLSGGQQQRIAIARALLSDKPIILLDEPTAHLDIETEFEIKQLMQTVFKDKQVILATHRLHWMKHMDSIYMLTNGRIEDHGSHETLIDERGAYYQFVHWREERA